MNGSKRLLGESGELDTNLAEAPLVEPPQERNRHWAEGCSVPSLQNGVIHVWHMGAMKKSTDELRRDLSVEECARADRFSFDRDRLRFLRAHYGLRCLLAGYLNVQPAKIEFEKNEYGKPRISYEVGINFNVSHSEDDVVVAVGRSVDIGVDIERRRPLNDMLGVARTVFSHSEMASLSLLSGEALIDAFYLCWTRKEAYLKAIGTGLATVPSTVTVGISRDELIVPPLGKHPACMVSTLSMDDRHALSLAVVGRWERVESFKVCFQ
jgi:4'-phosphopantetheinyl transferase